HIRHRHGPSRLEPRALSDSAFGHVSHRDSEGLSMIWFWSRAKEQLQLETRFDNDTRENVLAIRYADNRQEFEPFRDIASFQHRLRSLEKQLEADQWVQSGTPVFDPTGFPKKHS